MAFDPASLKELYTESKFWIAFAGFMWSTLKAVQWVRDIKEKDIPAIRVSVDQVHDVMKEQNMKLDRNSREQTDTLINCFKEQTSAVVRELQEQRSDMRTIFFPQAPVLAATKSKPKRRPAAKKTAAKRPVKAK